MSEGTPGSPRVERMEAVAQGSDLGLALQWGKELPVGGQSTVSSRTCSHPDTPRGCLCDFSPPRQP